MNEGSIIDLIILKLKLIFILINIMHLLWKKKRREEEEKRIIKNIIINNNNKKYYTHHHHVVSQDELKGNGGPKVIRCMKSKYCEMMECIRWL